MPKRKRSTAVEVVTPAATPLPVPAIVPLPKVARRARSRAQPASASLDPNPNTNEAIKDGQDAPRASPDSATEDLAPKTGSKPTASARSKKVVKQESDTPPNSTLLHVADQGLNPAKSRKNTPAPKQEAAVKIHMGQLGDPEEDGDEAADPEEIQEALSRPPPVNSSYLPLPWKGRLGYACLNTYLRNAHVPVFSSRTCRIASILEHRHPLKDPSQPEHATKNRPDKDQPADIARGQAYVEALGLANARDIVKMLRWNDRYGIKFLRLSSEMFPFASHDVYGYKLAPFASTALGEAGKVAAELGHRLTTHPGQFTQLGSPRKEVITASIRDLEYHCELLDLLKLPPQQDRDAVMILHMGGIFGDKSATLQRFRENYQKLSSGIKKRLVLENDDVCYSVHDLLPICEELDIPMVLDYHHHNIVFNADKIREGTLDITDLYDRINATWTRKGITQKMHYSEPTPSAVTARQRRKHNPRVATLPPCAPDMDLMIEAKDKEQAVFELMRTFKLPGFETFNDILPHVRNDENKPWKAPKKGKSPRKKQESGNEQGQEEEAAELQPPQPVLESEVSMGGPEGRVYWPPSMEDWLRPKKREVMPRDAAKALSTAEKAAQRRAEKAAWQATQEANAGSNGLESRELSTSMSASEMASQAIPKLDIEKHKSVYDKPKASKVKAQPARVSSTAQKPKNVKGVPTPSTSEASVEEEADDFDMAVLTDADEVPIQARSARNKTKTASTNRQRPSVGGRTTSRQKKAVQYAEDESESDD